MVSFERKPRYCFDDLIHILRILRAPDGCPWDRVQTHLSNRRNFLEEAYEAAEAFDADDPSLMCEELGDMLMQVLFNIHIEEDAGRFTLDDVTDRVCKKLIFRHPAIFSDDCAAAEQAANWDALKQQEKGFSSTAEAMDSVARSLPALWRAEKLQKKASAAGLAPSFLFSEMVEEQGENLFHAISSAPDSQKAIGRLLFYIVGICRSLQIDPEDALHSFCEDFITRFQSLEQSCRTGGRDLASLSAEEYGQFWQAATKP